MEEGQGRREIRAPEMDPGTGSSDPTIHGSTLLRWGSALLMLGGLGLLPASRAIALAQNPGAISSLGRRLYAGGLATLCLALLLVAIAAVPLRRGERWAFWAYAGAAAIFGLPMIAIDTLYVPVALLARTVAPQVVGLAVMSIGLAMCAQELYGKR